MGLAVEVGVQSYFMENDEDGAKSMRQSLKKVNAVLAKKGLPEHVEPERLPKLESRAACNSFPYSFLHYLRRFYAHASANPRWKPKPFPMTQDPAEDPVVEDAMLMFESHLLCHSDCEGYYFPIDFDEPVFEKQIPGGMLGSSQGLKRELVITAPFLGIRIKDGALSDAEANRVNERAKTEEGFWIEQLVWLSLFEAARLSIEHKTAICFC